MSLRLCLEWWAEVLKLEIVQSRPLVKVSSPWVQLYADARGSPARLAVVLLIDERFLHSDWEPDAELLKIFQEGATIRL